MSVSAPYGSITIRQETGPNLPLIPEFRRYYEAVADIALKDRDLGPAHIALAASNGFNLHQPQYNKPIREIAVLAREIDRAAETINTPSSIPVIGFNRFLWSASLAAPDSRLQISSKQPFETDPSKGTDLRAEVRTDIPTLRGDFLHTDGYDDFQDRISSGEERDTFFVAAPSIALSDQSRIDDAQYRMIFEKTLKGESGFTAFAAGKVAVSQSLEKLAEYELGDGQHSVEFFSSSIALRILAHFRKHDDELPASRSDVVRAAGIHAVSSLLAGRPEARRNGTGKRAHPVTLRLGGVVFKAEDCDEITQNTLKIMENRNLLDTIGSVTHTNRTSTIEYVDHMVTTAMQYLFGVELS